MRTARLGKPLCALALTASNRAGEAKAERRVNLRKAFQVAPENRSHLAGRRVLLVDDVMTTGATVSACAAKLIKAWARQVEVLTYAHALREGQGSMTRM